MAIIDKMAIIVIRAQGFMAQNMAIRVSNTRYEYYRHPTKKSSEQLNLYKSNGHNKIATV